MISSGLPAAIRSSTLPVRTAKVQRTLDLQITSGCIRVSRLHTSRCRLRNKWSFFRSENEPMRGHRGFLLEVPSHAGMFSPRAANPT